MARLTNVKVAGTPVPRPCEAVLEVSGAADADGRPHGKAYPPRVVIVRDATEEGLAVGFESAANGDGAFNYVDAEFTVLDAGRQPAYRVEVHRAFTSGWRLHKPADRGKRMVEVIELCGGKVTLHAGGRPVTYDVGPFGAGR